MTYLKELSDADLLELEASRQRDFHRREDRAKQSGLRSDRALADEAYTSLHIVREEIRERGINV